MPKIVRIEQVESIKPRPGTPVLPDGTIQDPVPYRAVDIEFDDGMSIQVERPITLAKIRAARGAAQAPTTPIDGFTIGQDIP